MHLASEEQSNLHGFATRPSLGTIVVPTPTIALAPSVHQFQPRNTPPPTCCSPNQVIIELSTTVIINDYQRFYSMDINSFIPTYFPTDDGSLITPALTDDLWDANLNLMLTAAFAMLFIRNIAVAIDYLRRGKMKNKTLFYLLLLSQALAPASFVPSLLSFFNQYISCTAVIVLSATTGSVALAILLTGILGIKAYKCMNNSKTVAAIITVLELGHAAFVVLDAIAIRGARRIAGSCLRTSDLRYTRISAAIQMAECCFMMFCFVYTCIKYRKTPGALGRISLRMSMEEHPFDARGAENQGEARMEAGNLGDFPQHDMPNEKITPSIGSSAHARPRSSIVLISSERPMNHPGSVRSHARKSMASSFSRLSKLLSNMASLRKVMRDELMYTCTITVVTTFALVFSFAGVNVSNGLSVTGWVALTWGLVSVLIIHSSSRVVRRHEREALVRFTAPGTISRAALATPRLGRPSDFWLSTSSPQMRNQRDTRTSEITEQSDPFSDRQQERRLSSQSGITSSTASNPSSPFVEITSSHDPAALPPSACELGFPTESGRVTPVVAHESTESILQKISQQWLLEKNTESQHSATGAEGSDEKSIHL